MASWQVAAEQAEKSLDYWRKRAMQLERDLGEARETIARFVEATEKVESVLLAFERQRGSALHHDLDSDLMGGPANGTHHD